MFVRSMHVWPALPQMRRRWLLGALLTGGMLGWLARADAATATSPRRAAAGGRRNTQAMPAALPLFLDHLIPADELTPSASSLKVHDRIWLAAQTDAGLLRLISVVCDWLDSYGEGFGTLHIDERDALLQWMSKAPWESPQRRFFHWMRTQAFTLYYTQPASWVGLPIERPPQPLGHVLD